MYISGHMQNDESSNSCPSSFRILATSHKSKATRLVQPICRTTESRPADGTPSPTCNRVHSSSPAQHTNRYYLRMCIFEWLSRGAASVQHLVCMCVCMYVLSAVTCMQLPAAGTVRSY